MDKKKTNSKKEANASRRPVSRSGDARETLKLEKAKALEDIHEIFQEVGREYPSFLEETEADELQFRGDGNLTTHMSNRKPEKREPRGPSPSVGRSGNLTLAQSQKILPKAKLQSIKKGVSFQGVSTAAEPRKQIKTTTLAKDEKRKSLPPIPGRKPAVPSSIVGPPPKPKPALSGPQPLKLKPLIKSTKREPALVELFSRKNVDTAMPLSTPSEDSLPNSPSTSDVPSSPNTMAGVLAEIVRHAELEAATEASGPFIDQTLLRNPGTCGPLSITLGLNANPKNNNKLKPLGDESRIALAQQITLASAKNPTNRKDQGHSHPMTKPKYTPFPLLARLPTVPEIIEHDDFADEFIQNIASNADRYEAPPPKEEIVLDYLPKETGDGEEVAPKPPPLDSMNSLKLVHTYPVWPHQVPLHKTLSHLPALKSVVLDDSEITWLRDLGSFLPNLITLSVMRCKLTSLDGTFAFPNLENLYAADNKIKSPAPVSCLELLRFLDLSGNKIESFEGFHFLRKCTDLRCMKLTDTGVSTFANFHTEIRRLIPSIRDLQPRIPAIHENILFGKQSDTPVKNPEPEDWYEYKVKRDMNWTSTSEASGTGPDVKIQPVTKDNTKSFKKLEYVETEAESQERDEENMDKEMDSMTEELEWRDEAIRLRQVYVPGRAEFARRGPTVSPHGIDEMDAFLDNLQDIDGLEKFRAAREKKDASMMRPMILLPPNFEDSFDDETDASRVSETPEDYRSDSTTSMIPS